MTFQLWSETNKEALKELKPDFGFKQWGQLSEDEKSKIWKYLETSCFFNGIPKNNLFHHFTMNEKSKYYEFYGEKWEQEIIFRRISESVFKLNNLYKAKSYAGQFLKDPTNFNACYDFYSIFINQNENVAIELLSLYSREIILERNYEEIDKRNRESKKNFIKRQEEWRWEAFDIFSETLNEVFSQFGLNIYLTRQGFIPKQDEKIIKEIYEPVLKSLSHPQWKEVSYLLSDAFSEYRKNTPESFSTCVTHVVASIQAFLQILVKRKTGVGDISKLIPEAQTNGLIPSDAFTTAIFKSIESILMRERRETGVAHPKKEYATEKNARLVLNLAMVFFQHCIIN